MKRKLLILCACLFGALTGVKAYTTADLTAAGWTLATNLDDITNNVYVLVDAGAQETAVVRGAAQANRPRYNTLSNPIFNKQEVWAIEKYGDNYAILGIEDNYYFSSGTEGWNDGMINGVDGNNGLFTFMLSGEKYDIRAASFSGDNYMGPWNNEGSVDLSGSRPSHDWTTDDGMEDIAVNKTSGQAPGYRLYKMAKRVYLQKYLRQVPNLAAPVDVSYLIFNSKIYQESNNTNTMPGGWFESDVTTSYRTSGTGNTRLKGFHEVTIKRVKIDYWQEIGNLPGGYYTATAGIRDNKPKNKFKTYLLNTTTTTRCESEAAPKVSDPVDRTTTPALAVDNGFAVHIGVWTGGENSEDATLEADNFRMSVDPYISTMATELPANGAMTAGLWYHFNVASAGKYVIAATTLNDIIYATGSTTTLSAAGSNKFTDVQNLSAGDYYVRSSSANTLTVTSCISTVAAELPANGEMTANDWYYFDIATAGHYDVVAGSLGNIVYTTDGNLAEGASVASKFSVKDNNLTATRYYVKSSSVQTLKWFLTDDQDYSSSMSSATSNWSCVAGKSVGDYPKQTPTGVEVYNGNNNDFTAGNILYQTINDLPNGNYEVVLWAWENFAPWEKSGTHPTGDNIAQVFANDAAYGINVVESTSASGDNDGFNDGNKYTLNCHVTNGTLTYGVKNIATGGNWAVCRPISLTYTGPYNEVVESGETQTYEGAFTENTVVTPTVEYPIVNISGASFTGTLTANFTSDQNGFIIATAEQKAALGDVKNVVVENTCDNLVLTDGVKAVIPAALTHATEATYSRTIGASTNFGTICVPFALESNDDIQYYTVKSISGDVLTLVETSTVDAGVPAVYKKKGAYAEETNIVITSSDADVEDEAGTQGATVQLIGTFTGLTVGDKDGTAGTAANGNYYIGTDNRFYQGANYITVNPFRAYITGSGENAARLTIQIEDENGTTSIVALEEFENENNLKDGKYLIDGKIVIVKNGVKYSANGQILK